MHFFFPNTSVFYEKKGIEKQQSHHFISMCTTVYSCKGQSFSDTFGSLQRTSVPIVSHVIVDMLMSA